MSFKRFWITVTTCFSMSWFVTAQELALSVVEGTHKPGGELMVALFVGNNGRDAYSPPQVISAYLKQEAPYDYKALDLMYTGAEVTPVVSGAYGKFVYRAVMPEGLAQAYYQLGFEDMSVEPVYVHMDQGSGVIKTKAEEPETKLAEKVAGSADQYAGASSMLDGVSTYKPIYFLFGNSPFDAKFQISLKYQLFNPKGDWAQNRHWLSGFHLGYTQVAFWDLAADSRPFEDTNFMPEAFYRFSDMKFDFLPDDSQLDFQIGLLHESNGRGGLDSRSLNIFYGRATYEQPLGDGWFYRFTGDVWDYVGDLKDNPDIAEFRGHSSFGLTVGAKKGIQFSSYRRGKLTNNKASYLFDVTVPIKRLGAVKNLNFTLHGQLFTGYGENLLTYDKKETRVRFGLGIHR